MIGGVRDAVGPLLPLLHAQHVGRQHHVSRNWRSRSVDIKVLLHFHSFLQRCLQKELFKLHFETKGLHSSFCYNLTQPCAHAHLQFSSNFGCAKAVRYLKLQQHVDLHFNCTFTGVNLCVRVIFQFAKWEGTKKTHIHNLLTDTSFVLSSSFANPGESYCEKATSNFVFRASAEFKFTN